MEHWLDSFYLRLYGVGHMVEDHSDSERRNPLPLYMGYSFRLAASVILYAPSHGLDSTYHGLCYTSRWAMYGTRNSSMGPPWRIDPTTIRTMSERSYQGATSRSTIQEDGNSLIFTSFLCKCCQWYLLFCLFVCFV